MDSEVAGSCRESTFLRSDEHSTQKRMGSRRYEKLVQCWKSRSRIIQINMDLKSANSLKNDGSRSWTVICRGVNKYVDELREENGESIYYEEMVNITEKPVATKPKGQ